jgi:apolipoprotein N-acyltransferase
MEIEPVLKKALGQLKISEQLTQLVGSHRRSMETAFSRIRNVVCYELTFDGENRRHDP